MILHAVDISKDAVDFAKAGVYDVPASQFTGTDVIERMSSAEIDQIFDRDERGMTVKTWIRNGIEWQVGDAGALSLFERMGPQDVVVANNFLCHMEAADAERCLRNAAGLVKPGGRLFVSGIDLAVRTEVATEMRWKPIPDLMREIHEGDSALKAGWPAEYWGLEPFSDKRHDWRIRYASAFQVGEAPLRIAEDAANTQATDRVFEMKEGD